MVATFGGPQGFLARWSQQAATDLPKGGLAAFRYLDAILRLIRYSEQGIADRRFRRDRAVCSMTEAELQAALRVQECERQALG
jgi:hypothetical protein